MESKVRQYARRILADHGCDEYTYGMECGETIIRDLKEAYPDGMEFPYIKVTNAIIAISKRKPLKRAKYRVLWDTDNCCDAYDCNSLGQAKADAEDTLINWATEEMSGWDGFNPTQKQIESYDYMIYNCSAVVQKYDPNADDYYTIWEPDYEEIGFLPWEELKKKVRKSLE